MQQPVAGGQPVSKSAISLEDWERRLDEVKIKKDDMNKLIMNFLVTEGYVDAAKAFQLESGTDTGVNLATITDRMEIRRAVQTGNVELAIEKVNDLDPEILEEHAELLFHLQQQHLIELIRKGAIDEAIEFAQDQLAPQGEDNLKFLNELERTVALLVFEDPAKSPMSDLLEPAQRARTASELNAAILASQSQAGKPKLPNLLKFLVWAQKELESKVHFPRMDDLVVAKPLESFRNGQEDVEMTGGEAGWQEEAATH